MNQEVKRLWVEALRSGEYEQGTGDLRTGTRTFCCLGVLCDIYHKQTGLGSWDVLSNRFYLNDGVQDYVDQELPHAVIDWSGVEDEAVTLTITDEELYRLTGRSRNELSMPPEKDPNLIDLNDNGVDFEAIARVIEEAL